MYRLFQNQASKLQKIYLPTKSSTLQAPSRTLYYFCKCCSCKAPNPIFTFIRLESTNNAFLSSLGKKKLKRKVRKYAELLEVTESSTNSTKAAVQNLSSAQLSILVDQPDITLDKLHKIKEKSSRKIDRKLFSSSRSNDIDKTRNSIQHFNLPGINDSFRNNECSQGQQISNQLSNSLDNARHQELDIEPESFEEDLKSSGILDETEVIKNSSLAESLQESSTFSEKCSDVEAPEEPIKSLIEKDRLAKEAEINSAKTKHFNKALLGYVNVCVNAGFLKEASTKVRLCSKVKSRDKAIFINDVSVYNALLQKYAQSSDLKNVLMLLQAMRKNDILFSPQTYAYTFHCIGRSRSGEKLKLLNQIHNEMLIDKISLNDVITKSVFVKDERSLVEAMIKLIDEKFVPHYETPDISYNCKLLNNVDRSTITPKSTIGNLTNICDLEKRFQKQIDAEISGLVTVHNISTQNLAVKPISQFRNIVVHLEKAWEKAAIEAFKRNLAALKIRESFQMGRKMHLYPYLSILKLEDYIRLLMQQVQKLALGSEMYSLPFIVLCRYLGNQVYKLYEAKQKKELGIIEKTSQVYLRYGDWFIQRNNLLNSRTQWIQLEHEANKDGVSLNVHIPQWQVNVQTSIGRFIFNIIINDLKVDTNILKKKRRNGHYVPGFFKVFRHTGMMLKEEVKPHPLISKLYRESQPETLTFDTTLVPSLCPPRPWVTPNEGGYIITQTDIIRMNHKGSQQLEKVFTCSQNKMFPAFDSLNQLSSIPWVVNSGVLKIALEVFKKGGSVELNMPQPPSALEPVPPLPKNSPSEDRRKYEKAKAELKRKKNEMYSLWCDALYRLSLADHFKDQVFWLPHNMDFRGRVYPIPPHLNHLGSDLARSILIFALKKPLGANGLNWLKLHIVNLTGFKKKNSVDERLKYADEIMDKITDSAENPLNGEMWWATSDEPWQTLAACMELVAAIKSPDPEKFESGFPIHQDGSCNGLQHYAALGRDKAGAESVNLAPSYAPQDVYQSVATLVEEIRQKDAQEGNKIAMILENFIKRKVIKQTIMTTVYGVTWFGAKLQIARQLKDLDNFPQENVWPASIYLVQKTFQTLRTMFKSAREIQDWFTECARLICITKEQNVEWETPLGLPVVQPYSKLNKSPFKGVAEAYLTPDIYGKPNVMKQKNAFPPNFVHSLDSCHMMLTSIHSENAGITFVSVHDCYWTHACTVEIMNKICREQFVALHNEPILEDLSDFLYNKFGFHDVIAEMNRDLEATSRKTLKYQAMKKKLNSTLKKVPPKGQFDLEQVLKSTYFFS